MKLSDFNNPNSIGLTRLNSSNRKVVSTFLQSQDSLDSLNADFSSYQVFSNDATVDDFPTEYISSQRLKQKNISSNFVLAAETGDLQTNIIVKSNDPGAHPVQLPIFKIEGGGQGVSSKISFILFRIAGRFKSTITIVGFSLAKESNLLMISGLKLRS